MNGVLPSITWGTWDLLVDSVPARHDSRTASLAPLDAIAKSARSRSKLDRKGLKAPVNSQLWFEEVLAHVDATPFGQHDCIYRCNPLLCLHHASHPESVIPWTTLPDGIHPRDGKLPPERIRKKRHQVENLAIFLQRLLQPGDVVVEFCAGSGYVALPLACMFPECTFVILDKKEPSLAIANERIAAAQLTNVEIFCGFIDDYDKAFDVGIALHACGEATDMVMEKCLTANAAYVLAPCCVGKIKLSALEYPRSATLHATLSRSEYQVLARAADFGHTNDASMALTPVNVRRRRCKSLLECDRNMRARERGNYETFMFVMHPHDATPKNDVLVGVPPARPSLRLDCDRVLGPHEQHRVLFGSHAAQ